MTGPPLLSVDALVRRLSLLPDRAMRRKEIRRWIHYGAAVVVAEQLQIIVERCFEGHDEARAAQMAFVDFLLFAGEEDEIPCTAIDLQAEKKGWKAAVLMLTDPPEHRRIRKSVRKNARLRKPIPLGMRKWKAMLNNPRLMEALAADPDPSVIANLCRNPSIREADVVAIASRRPNWSDILDTVARSRWLSSKEVQQALILNPYVRTGLAIGLLPQNGPRFLAILRYSGDLHPMLRKAAEYFLSLCPIGP